MKIYTTLLALLINAAVIAQTTWKADPETIDPLEDFYSSVPKFREFRDKEVNYHQGKAEKL